DLPLLHSNFRSTQSLAEYLVQHNVVAIADIDTRKLTRILRDKGAQNGCILAGENITEAEALEKARAFSGLNGLDLAKDCCDPEGFEWTDVSWSLGNGFSQPELNSMLLHTITVSKPTSYVCSQTAV